VSALFDAIIVMAGRGVRSNMRMNKVYYKVAGKPIFRHSVDAFYEVSDINTLILVVNPLDEVRTRTIMANYDSNRFKIVKGGATRQESVRNGLRVATSEHVLIHDAARPFLNQEMIHQVMESVLEHGFATFGIKATDTHAIVKDGFISKTIERDELYSIQTPQGGITALFLDAHEKAVKNNLFVTDDVTLIEKYHHRKIKVIDGSSDNIKITTPRDFKLAKAIASGRKQ